MAQFRKKPVVIGATQWDGSFTDMRRICREWPELKTGSASYHVERNTVEFWYIATLEGSHRVSPLDFVIRGVAGEFYPCKPDIFAATYDPVE